ncbi:MAG: hypothetical protein ACTSU2_12600 [Promethearchaeota archaeon]
MNEGNFGVRIYRDNYKRVFLACILPFPVFISLLLGLGQFIFEIPRYISSLMVNFIWILILVIYLGVYIFIPILLDKKRSLAIERLYIRTIERVTIIIDCIIFLVPLIWGSIYVGIVYTLYEFSVGIFMALIFVVFFLPALLFLGDNRRGNRKREVGAFYPAVVYLISTIIFTILGVLNPFLIIIGGLNSLSFFITLKYRRIRPTKREKSVIFVPIIIASILTTPYFLFEYGGGIEREYKIGNEGVADEFLIDWTWADDYDNPEGINSSILDALEYCNSLEHINVSVTVALPEEFMKGSLGNFSYNEIKKVLERNISVNLMPLVPREPNYFYINDFTVGRFYETYEVLKDWISCYNLWGNITSIILDMEPLVSNISDIFMAHYKIGFHMDAVESLARLIKIMKADMEPYGTKVIGATFGYFLDDFVDFDDSLFKFLGVATLSSRPATEWDAVGFMCYERGSDGYYSVYTQCLAITRYFGDYGIPYIISKQSYDDALMMFKIIRNLGFRYSGIWALQDFIQRRTEEGYNATQKLRELHEELNNPAEILFSRVSIESAFIHIGLVLGDLLLWDYPNLL